MEKKEKKSDLEWLFISLIEKGWRIENPNARIWDVKYMYWLRELRIVYETDRRDAVRQYPIRFLVSKDSNLWQFVCENGMIPKENHERVYDVSWWEYWVDCKAQIISREPEYRLIESSLKDESELEDFLLQNIKVWND